MKFDKLFGIAAIIFAMGYFMQSLPFAQAFPQGPNVGLGSNPYESFTGSIHDSNGNRTLLTVPSDQIFIVTTCVTNTNYINLNENSNTMIDGHSGACSGGALKDGNGHLVISSGSTLDVISTYGTRYYYIEGYYAQP